MIRDDEPVGGDLPDMLHRNAKPAQSAFTGEVQPLRALAFRSPASHLQIEEVNRPLKRCPK